MNIIPLGKSLSLSAAMAVLALMAPAAFAADEAPAATTANQPSTVQLGRIMVTGSAIPRTGVETPGRDRHGQGDRAERSHHDRRRGAFHHRR